MPSGRFYRLWGAAVQCRAVRAVRAVCRETPVGAVRCSGHGSATGGRLERVMPANDVLRERIGGIEQDGIDPIPLVRTC